MGASATTGFCSRRFLAFFGDGGPNSRILNVGGLVNDAEASCITGFTGSDVAATAGTGRGFFRSILSAMRGGMGAAFVSHLMLGSGSTSQSVPRMTPPASRQTTAA